MFLLYEAECHWIVCSFFCHSFQFPSDATMFSLAVENIPFRCLLFFGVVFWKGSKCCTIHVEGLSQRRERNEVLQEWEWMTDEHRNTVGSNTDSFHKAVFLTFYCCCLGFLIYFFLAATVNISKCHKIEQHKETYAAPTEFTFLREWIVQWQVLGCLTQVLMGQQIFLAYLRLPRWAPIRLLLRFFFSFCICK